MGQINKDIVSKIVVEVVKKLKEYNESILIGVSNRHVHLSQEDVEVLFGSGYKLKKMKDLYQDGYFAAEESVTITGPKGSIKNVRILGPLRKETQVEISVTDGFILGIKPPIKESGKIDGTPGITISGPKGTLIKDKGVIAALRHIHISTEYAKKNGIKDGDMLSVRTEGTRSLVFCNVLARVSDKFKLEMHIDVDEANSSGLKSGDRVKIVKC